MRLILLVIFAATVSAQEANAPMLSPTQVNTLQILDLQLENATLMLQLVQLRREVYVQSLRREGYALHRLPSGIWEYTKNPVNP